MTASPIIFYSMLDRWGWERFSKRFMVVVFASLLAIFASILILLFQAASVSGDFLSGTQYVIETINRRTLSNDPGLPSVYDQVGLASTWSILKIYFEKSYFYKIKVPYYVFIILFAVVSMIYFLAGRIGSKTPDADTKPIALIAATWFSFLGPLSWYTIFKSVAYFHTHMNFLPWHIPFTLFGFRMVGYFIETTLKRLNINMRKA